MIPVAKFNNVVIVDNTDDKKPLQMTIKKTKICILLIDVTSGKREKFYIKKGT